MLADALAPIHRERKALEEKGITFSLHERSEVWADIAGGARSGTSYDGLTIAKLDIDLEKAAGWQGGEFFASGFDIHGHGPSRSMVGNLQLVSNIEASPSVKLYDLWLGQALLDGKLSLRVGQEGANDEMMVSTYGGLFLNSSFGFPGMPAADLPSGGPNYPLATPFARAQIEPTDAVRLLAAIYNGNPAPNGSGDPQLRDRNGAAFRLNDHMLSFAELWFLPDPAASSALPTTYKIGAWYSSDRFADERFAVDGSLLANPATAAPPLSHAGDWAIYAVVDQMVWRRTGTGDQGIGLFALAMAGPSDRNLSNLYVEGGVNWRAPLASRPNDTAGIAVAYLGISPAAQAYSRDLVIFGRIASPYTAGETVIETTYLAPVTNRLVLQPDLQYVIAPGAGIPGSFGKRPSADAIVIGIRATFRF